jgi:hypothetical protein
MEATMRSDTDDRDEDYDSYYDYDESLDCEHEHYEIDVCTGLAECDQCPHSWYLTSEEVDRELDRQANYFEDMEREERQQRWRNITYPIRMFFFRILDRVWPRKALNVLHDDELPF